MSTTCETESSLFATGVADPQPAENVHPMGTDEIIRCYALAISRLDGRRPFTYSLPEFEQFLLRNKSDIVAELDNPALASVSFKSDALARLMNAVALDTAETLGVRPWDRQYVRSTYAKTFDGCDFVYFPARSPTKLLVNFSSMGKDRFDRYSRHWDPTQQWASDTACLFLKDDEFKYFLGDDKRPRTGSYIRLINQFRAINRLKQNQVFTIGGSMGGYAALYYALTMGLGGSIVGAPQTTLRAMDAHTYRNWSNHARSTGSQWRDLDMLVHSTKGTPFVYIEHGSYPADVLAVEALTKELRKKSSLLMVRKTSWDQHTVDSVLPQAGVDAVIAYFEAHFKLGANY